MHQPLESFNQWCPISQVATIGPVEYGSVTALLVPQPIAATAAPRRAGRRWRMPVAMGLLGFAIVWPGSWIPSFWGDEAASVMSAQRSMPSLLRMLGHVDAVHGAYYL